MQQNHGCTTECLGGRRSRNLATFVLLGTAWMAAVRPSAGEDAGTQQDYYTARPHEAVVASALIKRKKLVPGGPLELIAPRGGRAWGAVIAALGDPPPDPVEATCGDLKNSAGGVIPAARVRFQYRDGETLRDACTANTNLHLWVTVSVPEDVAAGTYEGVISVAGLSVPVALTASPFRLPSWDERRMLLHMVQSPDSVALYYGVEPHSERHFALLEKSLALMGNVDNNVLRIPVIHNTWEGDRTGIIRFRRRDGKLTPDFTAFETYLTLYRKHAQPPKLLILRLWDAYMAGHTGRRQEQNSPLLGKIRITEVLDDGTLAATEIESYPAHRDLWQAVIDGVIERLPAFDIKREALRIGTASDAHATEEVGRFFQDIAPGVTWAAWSHGFNYIPTDKGLAGGNGTYHVTYLEQPFLSCADAPIRRGWEDKPVHWVSNSRCMFGSQTGGRNAGPWKGNHLLFLLVPDASVGMGASHLSGAHASLGLKFDLSSCSGMGRNGIDFWPIKPPAPPKADGDGEPDAEPAPPRRRAPKPIQLWLKPEVDPGQIAWNAYGRLDRGGTPRALAEPGEHGALNTMRLELLAAGVQVVETRIWVERMIESGQAGEELAARFKALPPYDSQGRNKDVPSNFYRFIGAVAKSFPVWRGDFGRVFKQRHDAYLDIAGAIAERMAAEAGSEGQK